MEPGKVWQYYQSTVIVQYKIKEHEGEDYDDEKYVDNGVCDALAMKWLSLFFNDCEERDVEMYKYTTAKECIDKYIAYQKEALIKGSVSFNPKAREKLIGKFGLKKLSGGGVMSALKDKFEQLVALCSKSETKLGAILSMSYTPDVEKPLVNHSHAIALGYKEGAYFYFDPNEGEYFEGKGEEFAKLLKIYAPEDDEDFEGISSSSSSVNINIMTLA